MEKIEVRVNSKKETATGHYEIELTPTKHYSEAYHGNTNIIYRNDEMELYLDNTISLFTTKKDVAEQFITGKKYAINFTPAE